MTGPRVPLPTGIRSTERTGVISVPNRPDGDNWRVAGEGAVYWFARGATEPLIGRHGDVLHLPL